MDIYKNLTTYDIDMGDVRRAYDIDEIRREYTHVYDLSPNAVLAIFEKRDDFGIFSVEYAFYSFMMSNCDGTEARYRCEWRGSGTGDTLREMRHTYFNPDEPDYQGYMFYLPIDDTIKALTILKRYFD